MRENFDRASAHWLIIFHIRAYSYDFSNFCLWTVKISSTRMPLTCVDELPEKFHNLLMSNTFDAPQRLDNLPVRRHEALQVWLTFIVESGHNIDIPTRTSLAH